MSIRSEFQLKRFGFQDVEDNQIFGMQLPHIPSSVILVYRVIITLYFIGSVIFDIWTDSGGIKWLIFLTSWMWLLCAMYYLTITFVSGYYWWKLHNHETYELTMPVGVTMPAGVRIVTWILFDASLGISLLVTVMFWGFVVDSGNFATPLTTYLSISEHSVNLILLLIDFFFHRIPVRIFHAIYPIIFGAIYLTFCGVYYSITREIIYSILDWRKHIDSAIMYAVLSLSFMIVGQFLFYLFHRLKVKCCLIQEVEDDEEETIVEV